MKQQDYDDKSLIPLANISEEARGTLVKAASFAHIPFNDRVHNKEYLDLYHKFQEQTHNEFAYKSGEDTGESFSRFEVAAIRLKRKIATLYYKDAPQTDYETKDGRDFSGYDIKRKVFEELKI